MGEVMHVLVIYLIGNSMKRYTLLFTAIRILYQDTE
jgi:hypothetical protein